MFIEDANTSDPESSTFKKTIGVTFVGAAIGAAIAKAKGQKPTLGALAGGLVALLALDLSKDAHYFLK